MSLRNMLLVAVGGSIGSVLRYITGVVIKHNTFPYSTLIVNILGSFVIGMVMAYVMKQQDGGYWRLLLATGLCGGFTTFSALSWETLQMLQQQRYTTALWYVSISIFTGLIATFLGYWLLK